MCRARFTVTTSIPSHNLESCAACSAAFSCFCLPRSSGISAPPDATIFPQDPSFPAAPKLSPTCLFLALYSPCRTGVSWRLSSTLHIIRSGVNCSALWHYLHFPWLPGGYQHVTGTCRTSRTVKASLITHIYPFFTPLFLVPRVSTTLLARVEACPERTLAGLGCTPSFSEGHR